jgi:predicted nucleic acid-binding protein
MNIAALADGALLLMDSAPIIYFLEGHAKFSPIFKPFFVAHDSGRVQFAVTTISLAEVLTGPLQAGDEALVERYRAILESWQVVDLTAEIAANAARLRASLRLKLADAVQAASAISINADALVTHDRDFSRVHTLRVLP